MASSYTSKLRLEKQGTGENNNTWGDRLNSNVIDLVDSAIAGLVSVAFTAAAVTLTANNGSSDQARSAILVLSGTLTSSVDMLVPAVSKPFWVYNNTAGAFNITAKVAGGTGTVVPQGALSFLLCDGTSVYGQSAIPGPLTVRGAVSIQGALTASGALTIGGAASIASTLVVTSATTFSDNTSIASGKVHFGGIMFRASRSAVVSVTNGVLTTIEYNTEQFDLGGGFNTSNGRFVAPVAGHYRFRASAQLDSCADGANVDLYLYLNNGQLSAGRVALGVAGNPVIKVEDSVSLAANDYINVQMLQSDSTTRTINATNVVTYFAGEFIG